MYIFDGSAIVINIRAEAKNKQRYPSILKKAVIFTLTLFIAFSTLTYLVYREECLPLLTMNFRPVNGIVIFIFGCVCINALTSLPV